MLWTKVLVIIFMPKGLANKLFIFSRRVSQMNRRVSQNIDNMNFNSA